MNSEQIKEEVKLIKQIGRKISKSKKKSQQFLKDIEHDKLLELSASSERESEQEREKMDEEFRHILYGIEGLSSEDYKLADALKDYVDKKFEFILHNQNKIK